MEVTSPQVKVLAGLQLLSRGEPSGVTVVEHRSLEGYTTPADFPTVLEAADLRSSCGETWHPVRACSGISEDCPVAVASNIRERVAKKQVRVPLISA